VSRSRQIAERAQGDGQARSLSNLRITSRHLDSDYQLVQHDLTRGQTGLLRVFSLVPKTAGKPTFEARVDDGSPGSRRDPELDIDIRGVPDAASRDFKRNRNGFGGHHTNRSPDATHRVFDLDIDTPAGSIFEGEGSFNAEFSVAVLMTTASAVTADAVVIRASRTKRLCIRLTKLFRKLFARLRSLLK
jgi:hypothetical protein